MDDLVGRQPTWYDAVPPDPNHAKAVLERLLEEEVVAVLTQTATAITGNLDGLHRTAHTLAYDAARKAVDAPVGGLGVPRHTRGWPRGNSGSHPPRPVVTVSERRPLTQNCIRLVHDAREMSGLARRDDLVPTDDKALAWADRTRGGR